MANVKITYQHLKGRPTTSELDALCACYQALFEDARVPFFKQRFQEHPMALSVLAFHDAKLIGFKIGYPYNDTTFYSWVGGVLPEYRQQGIAKHMAALQTALVKDSGFTKLRTKSMNRFKPMMIFNLKSGFDIVKCYTNASGQTKIVFEKPID